MFGFRKERFGIPLLSSPTLVRILIKIFTFYMVQGFSVLEGLSSSLVLMGCSALRVINAGTAFVVNDFMVPCGSVVAFFPSFFHKGRFFGSRIFGSVQNKMRGGCFFEI